MERPETGHPQRRTRRIRHRAPVSLYDGKRQFPAELRDLSEGGAFVAVEPPIPLGTGVSFWLALEGEKLLIRGYVRWTRSLPGAGGEPVGCGLEFYDPDGGATRSIVALLDRVESRGK